MNFVSFWASWVMYAPRGLKIASKLLQDGLLEPIWAQVGSKLVQVGPILARVGSNLAQVWAHVRPISGSPVALGPTQALPNPFPVASWPTKPCVCPARLEIDPKKPSQPIKLDPKSPT